MTSISFLPQVSNSDELNDLISRSAWFLSSYKLNKIYIYIGSNHLSQANWEVAKGMDPSITMLLDSLRSKVMLVHVSSEIDFEPYIAKTDIILKWKLDTMSEFISPQKLNTWEMDKKVWSVDPKKTRMEGSFYVDVGLHLQENTALLIQENKQKFATLVSKLGFFEQAYLIATGPSASKYKKFEYKNSISIVCNSVIMDEDLMAFVKPQILVFADPIFHFGPSKYAAAFRQKLREVACIYDFSIVIPFKYYGLFISIMPELRDRTIAIPFSKDRPFNFDLTQEFEVKTTANILTLLLVPLAATFSKKIGILGCDGRPLDEDKYFWGHNQKTQINDQMMNIREIHPAFFSINYNNYYLEHCETLEKQLQDGELIDKTFISLSFSYIPALRKRVELGGWQKIIPHKHLTTHNVIIVDPDAKSWSGHYMAYNEKLSLQLKEDGVEVKVICRKDLSIDILSDRPYYFPALTTHSWEVGNRTQNKIFLATFESEIEVSLRKILDRHDGPVLLYMYCGSLEHAEVLLKLTHKYQTVSININLFWLSFRLTSEYAQIWKPFIENIERNIDEGRFIATLPTMEIRTRLAELTGCFLPVAPHPSTGVSDQKFRELLKHEPLDINKKVLNVLFPSSPRPEKGYLTSIDSAKLLCEQPTNFNPIIRYAPIHSTPENFAYSLSEISKVEVLEGELNDDDFIKLFLRSDIVVLPYTPDAFSERTSGLLVDALYFGIPCVVVRGTWLGNLIEKFGGGVVVDELSATTLVEGIKKIAINFYAYRELARVARSLYFQNNSWSLFSKLLRLQSNLIQNMQYKVEPPSSLIQPYTRSSHAHWDETLAIQMLFRDILSGSTMIDVGAHHGSALVPFLNLGWQVFAFEPDEKNRAQLLGRLSKHVNSSLVSIDTRCISNKSEKGISFFTSDQSTGISGLSAFHETHQETQKVDTTTLTDFFRDKEIPSIDFLKIDTEGHDLFVLQGYPWGRSKPAIIECEFEDTKTVPLGYTFHDLANFLVEKGYTVYVSEWHPIIRYGIRHDWRQLMRYPCELADPKGWGNLLAFRDPINEGDLIAAVRKVLKTNPETNDTKLTSNNISTQREITFHIANRLFRDGKISEALSSYLELHKRNPLKIYEDNAFFCARRLGMKNINSIKEIALAHQSI